MSQGGKDGITQFVRLETLNTCSTEQENSVYADHVQVTCSIHTT